MTRNIKITIDSTTNNENLVYINNINSIVNYACDSIEIDCLEALSEQTHASVINILLNKLRPKGKLIVSIYNPKIIAENFLASTISNQEFLQFFINKQSLLSLEALYTFIDFNSFDIIHLQSMGHIMTLIVERK